MSTLLIYFCAPFCVAFLSVLVIAAVFKVRDIFRAIKRIRMAGYDELSDDPELEEEAMAVVSGFCPGCGRKWTSIGSNNGPYCFGEKCSLAADAQL